MDEKELGLFDGKERPSVEWAWRHYNDSVAYNTKLDLQETVKANENFYIGK